MNVLAAMNPLQVRESLSSFSPSYVVDWDRWLEAPPERRTALFAAILRRWQATRPLPMRRPRAEADHEPPHIEDLLERAGPHLRTIGDLGVTDLGRATGGQIDALHGLWATFSQLPQTGTASCVGITKAVLLLTDGRIGPAFDSTVRTKLGLKRHLRSSGEWVEALRRVGRDIDAFELRHGCLASNVPDHFSRYHAGRIYDMVLGPKVSRSAVAIVDPSHD